ncbi:hypothetical protein P7H00_09020 [Enterococcus pseudoavium]|uniref:Uncharacterized protein n=1 Tax=Enterococcus pseudoavium TaxID=44007 RepID=A0AAE4L2W9_9ENTE|nr:hypothetical protein [Enterococcus pseudoavium]MDT2737268.1 hypothetical protein [Enterococcus pseudoavium]MDT2755682.1 hypothetical protein [Enterococcus pseudoavium]MDT2771612.1 hypothetical protein [Enterococcus pseudoavium]
MKKWTYAIIERLESAYRVRFEKEAVLVFLNDAYQNALMLRRDFTLETDEGLADFLTEFDHTRDLFISQAIDRYPSNYNKVAEKISALKKLNESIA